MKISNDIKMFNRVIYYPICKDGKYVTYIKVTPSDAIIIREGRSEKIHDASVVDGADAERIANSNIQQIVGYMLDDANVTIVHAPAVNPMNQEI